MLLVFIIQENLLFRPGIWLSPTLFYTAINETKNDNYREKGISQMYQYTMKKTTHVYIYVCIILKIVLFVKMVTTFRAEYKTRWECFILFYLFFFLSTDANKSCDG